MTFLAHPLIATGRKGTRRNIGKAGANQKSLRKVAPLHNILVASSDRREREYWSALLSHSGCSVLSVKDGETALRAVRDDHIDIVVAAVEMSKLDGLELLREISQLSRPPAVILIAKGGSEMDRIYLKVGKLYGAAAIYTQPLDPREFISGVRAALGGGDIGLVER